MQEPLQEKIGVRGGNQRNPNLANIKDFYRTSQTPRSKKVARRVGTLFTLAPLAKAFRGELVPQDPNNEPASALFERLHAQSATATTKPKRGRRKAQA